MQQRTNLMKKLMIIASLIGGPAIAQNLVFNPGFEINGINKTMQYGPATSYFDIYGLHHWSQPTGGSSDYYFTSKSGQVNTKMYGGQKEAASGIGLVGFIAWVPDREYREYTQGELSEPLVAGKKYKFTMKVCAGPQCPYLVNDLGVYFSKDKINDWSTDQTLNLQPQIWLDATAMHANPTQWITVQNVFTAKGGERFFNIGNFMNDSATIVTPCAGDKVLCPYAYFYMDDISVELTNEDPVFRYQPTSLAKQIQAGKTFIARGVNFDLDKATLRPESYIQLHEIAAELKQKPSLKIDIRGYTDSTGNEAHNLQLSRARAKAVADYLISTGIDKSRITYGGYGSANPVSTYDPALNRRVEFVFR